MKYEKEVWIHKTTVSGNIRDFTQSYEGFYYPRANDLVDKFALYIYLDSPDKSNAIRSIYFSSHEQLKELIIDLTVAYFRFRDKRIKPDIPLSQFRNISLTDFLESLRTKLVNFWKK